jgi:hypothetical protein
LTNFATSSSVIGPGKEISAAPGKITKPTSSGLRAVAHRPAESACKILIAINIDFICRAVDGTHI